MDVFALRDHVVDEYRQYVTSFLNVRDDLLHNHVESALASGHLWPDPRIGLNPAFEPGGWIDELVDRGLLHEGCRRIFRIRKGDDSPTGEPMRLHRHQVDAIEAARAGRNYVLTTGTGSGKSLAYIAPIVDHVLRNGTGKGVQAIVVYPMNALANSQQEELRKFLGYGWDGGPAPVTFRRYTGQENEDERKAILDDPPDIILTNYVMLELILTRVRDRRLVERAQGLRFLVLDELHTYRGRQGADVALLVRRTREACKADQLQCVGTSATLAAGGSLANQRAEVARVASLLFGAEVEPEGVIGETLRRATPFRSDDDPDFVHDLTERLRSGVPPSGSYDAFVADPLSSWIESTLGVEEVDGRLVRVAARPITGQAGVASALEKLTGVDTETCETAIRAQLMGGYEAVNPDTKFPAFAFRLHQFISKGDTLYSSPEAPARRYVTLQGQRFVPGDRSRVLLPLAFCRVCGQDYFVVQRSGPLVDDDDRDATRFTPRDLGDRGEEDGREAGFLYAAEDDPWPSDPSQELERLPDDWLEPATGGSVRLKSSFRSNRPLPLAVAADGSVVTEPNAGTRAWWVPAPFRFCLHCGVSYAGRLGSDFSRLATLGSEGRSTATTVLSLSAVRALRRDETLHKIARKLLAFTDNRQDASLQAGHFNDFVQVALLRAALHAAVSAAGAEGVPHDELTRAVFDALDLPMREYAVDPEVEFAAKVETERALRDVLGYLLYLDQRRGWRLTSPNLEQCGLLEIEYVALDEVSRAERLWASAHPALQTATADVRAAVCHTLLDLLRRELCIKVDYLDADYQERLLQRSSQRLNGAWALDEASPLEHASALVPRPRRPTDYRGFTYLSSRSLYGQYLRRPTTLPGWHEPLKVVHTDQIIPDLLGALKIAGLVEETAGPADTPAFQVPASAMRWTVGDGVPRPDVLRQTGGDTNDRHANPFFVELYSELARDLVGIEAREHTAQVPQEDREDREGRFRTADLPVLFCSPTMELGVDIAELNVVGLRNVPPTPANYAQRSGRAGRSGQPALVITYCSSGSPHDQWFFRRPELMVSGQVSPPRLDLANEDLVRAHVHAIWLSRAQMNLHSSLIELVDVSEHLPEPELFPSVRSDLQRPEPRAWAKATAERVLADLQPQLEEAPWWGPTWLDDALNSIPAAFEGACERWIELYTAASAQQAAQNKIVLDPNRASGDRKQAARLRREAEVQLEILRASTETRTQSDFYSYRYFASEGFLPGYSFPRLPLSAYVPGRRQRMGQEGEFISRPRFLAISEFGPRAFVYHEGVRYTINRVILPVGAAADPSSDTLVTQQAKRCTHCGYLHPVTGDANADVCDRCGTELPGPLHDLFRMQNVSTKRRDRISSDEEERQKQGYELQTAVRFATRHSRASVRTATVADGGGDPLLTLAYGDTADLWRINVGWRRRKTAAMGFLLDVERGYWARNDDDATTDEGDAPDPMSARQRRVIPFVEDRRNCLLVELAEPESAEVMASLQAALKQAIQVEFQLEDSELAAEPLPSPDLRRILLFYESAEGGAGVLRRLVDEEDVLGRVARSALEVCHFDPVTAEDRSKAPDASERCEAACYDCLMSYTNQPDHGLLDRQVAKPWLLRLRDATVEPSPVDATAEEHHRRLVTAADSALEKEFLEYLKSQGLRLPDRHHVVFTEADTEPDFVYDEAFTVVYVDGPAHDHPDRAQRDRDRTEALRQLGWTVIRFGHHDDWAQKVDTYRWVFGGSS